MAANPISLIGKKVGDFWHETRRDWCAYCGVALTEVKERQKPTNAATKDHVIPKAHGGGYVTLPCCQECNKKKGTLSLPEFTSSAYFNKVRQEKRPNALSLRDLWLAIALAAAYQAKRYSDEWPGS